jgi:peptidoglycan/LPS O-acetylase OafA/YrhL
MNSEDFNLLIKISSRLILLVSASVLMFSVFFYLKNLDITSSPVLVFLTKAALPFYLIHHPLVLLFGYLTKDYTENTFLQFLLICFLTYTFSLLFSYLVLQSEYTKKVFGIR